MAEMIYRSLGRHADKVSIIGLGSEHMEKLPQQESIEIMHAALDAGINIMDLFMPNPEIRRTIGKALDGRRKEMLIQGHIGVVWEEGQYKRSREAEASKDHFLRLLEDLRTDYIDILMIHYVDKLEDVERVFAPGGLFDVALSMKEQGKARYIGMSSHEVSAAREAIRRSAGQLDVLMFSVNPYHDLLPGNTDIEVMFKPEELDRHAEAGQNSERAELYRTCAREGIAITVMKPYGGGILLGEKSPLGKMNTSQCLHYALSRPGVVSALAGYSSLEHLQAALSYLDASDADKDLQQLMQQQNWARMQGICMYCNHCLPCPSKIDIAAVQKLNDLWQEDEALHAKLQAQYDALPAKAGDCIECGSCEANCPFHVAIIAKMQQARQRFGA